MAQTAAEDLLTAQDLGDLHRHRREALGLSMCAYARLIGVDEKTVRNWEAGELEGFAILLGSFSRLGYTLQRRPDFSPDRLLPVKA